MARPNFTIFAVILNLIYIFTTTPAVAAANDTCDADYTTDLNPVVVLAKLAISLPITVINYDDYPPISTDVTFWCIKPGAADFQQAFVNDTDIADKIDFKKPVGLLIHGYLGSFKDDNHYWMYRTSKNWANVDNRTVCSVDWHRLASYDYVTVALNHTIRVANYTTLFIKFLATKGVSINATHITGHSFGAQIAHSIGQTLGGQIGKIFGLDPAGILYTRLLDRPAYTLNPSSAQYVQCIHTGRFLIGTFYPCGHNDFFPNMGYDTEQINCHDPVCSHGRAIYYFESSLNRSRIFNGTQCANDDDALEHQLTNYQCSNNHDLLGIFSAQKPGLFYLNVTGCYPYCAGCTR